MHTAYLEHPDCNRHEMGPDHPECPQRLYAINDSLVAGGLMDLLRYYPAPLATREQVLRVHTAEYLDGLEALSPPQGRVTLDADTALNPHSLQAAYRAAGAVVRATELVLEGAVHNAFCAVRPPGHHAEPGQAMGFCLFNNIAIGAKHALEAGGLERVAIVDFDVHHGNGTEVAFAGDERVLFCSSYQYPLYPYVPPNTHDRNIISTALKAGDGGEAFRAVVSERWLPALEAFRPQMIFISAGFDAHAEDDIADIRLYESDYTWVTQEILRIAERHAHRRVVSALEGGYCLYRLGSSVAAHVRVLLGI